MEEFQVKVVQGGTFYEDKAKPLYDQFLVQKPDVSVFGIELTVGMLRDATYSLLAYTMRLKNMTFDIAALVDYVDKYSRIYYLAVDTATEDGILILLRSIIYDFLTKHSFDEKPCEGLPESIYQRIRDMIVVTKHG